jgi:hypothetical protein
MWPATAAHADDDEWNERWHYCVDLAVEDVEAHLVSIQPENLTTTSGRSTAPGSKGLQASTLLLLNP